MPTVYIINVCVIYALMSGGIGIPFKGEKMNCTDHIAITLKQSSLLLEITKHARAAIVCVCLLPEATHHPHSQIWPTDRPHTLTDRPTNQPHTHTHTHTHLTN